MALGRLVKPVAKQYRSLPHGKWQALAVGQDRSLTNRSGVNGDRSQLQAWIGRDCEMLIEFLRGFVRCKGPNPPGDTRSTAAYIMALLEQEGLAFSTISPHPEMSNIVASFEGGAPGRHLVGQYTSLVNGHIVVFPVPDGGRGWSRDPWGGELIDGRIYSRRRHEMRHQCLDFHVCLLKPQQGTAEGKVDVDGRFR